MLDLSFVRAIAIALPLIAFSSATLAAGIEVEPVLLEVAQPAAATSITLRLTDSRSANVQVRVERWTQADGVETLAGTDDVVVSPPAAKMKPGVDYTVRVVRVSKRPIRGEESYRLIVDQLPNLSSEDPQAVRLLVRQSIPLFFAGETVAPAKVKWALMESGDRTLLVATNAGDRRLRLASLRLTDEAGKTVEFGDGLLGYVLGKSTMAWELPAGSRSFGRKGTIKVSAQSDVGPVSGTAAWRGSK